MHANISFSDLILSSISVIYLLNSAVSVFGSLYVTPIITFFLFSNMIFVNLYEDRFDRVILVANVISTKYSISSWMKIETPPPALADLYLCIALSGVRSQESGVLYF